MIASRGPRARIIRLSPGGGCTRRRARPSARIPRAEAPTDSPAHRGSEVGRRLLPYAGSKAPLTRAWCQATFPLSSTLYLERWYSHEGTDVQDACRRSAAGGG